MTFATPLKVGIVGIGRLDRRHAECLAHQVIGLGHELTPVTQGGLLSGHLHAVLSHPLDLLATRLVKRMTDLLTHSAQGFQQVIVPFDTQTPESG